MTRRLMWLGKPLKGDKLDGWIQLFNAKSEELDMLTAKYKGLGEAAEIMKRMSLGKALRYHYEAHLKAVKDRYREDEYIRDEGRAEGMTAGQIRGKTDDILQLLGDLGEVPEALAARIQKETDLQILSKWLRTAAKAESISKFEEELNRK